jgi:glycosyltransferase involved in cell wall biosynthesis
MPEVSLVMTVLNGARYVQQAVASVLSQTHRDLELVVVDDGSTDQTRAILGELTDPRLRVLALPHNVGTFVAANRGLALTDGAFVARIDADDLCHPRRVERQLELFAASPALGIVGSDAQLIDADGERRGVAPTPYTDVAIRWQCLLRTPFHHSTVMWRRELAVRHDLRYDERLRIGGDYELWTRFLEVTTARNQKAPVVSYRVWRGGITGEQRPEQRRIQNEISARTIARWLPDFEIEAAELAQLRDLLIIDRHHPGERAFGAPLRRTLAARYRALFEAFVRDRPPTPALAALRRAVARRAEHLEAA